LETPTTNGATAPAYRPNLANKIPPGPDPRRTLDPRYGDRTEGHIHDPEGDAWLCWARYVYTDGTALVCTWGLSEANYWSAVRMASKDAPKAGHFIPRDIDPRAHLVETPATLAAKEEPASPPPQPVGPWVERLDRIDKAIERLEQVTAALTRRTEIPAVLLEEILAALPAKLESGVDAPPEIVAALDVARSRLGIRGRPAPEPIPEPTLAPELPATGLAALEPVAPAPLKVLEATPAPKDEPEARGPVVETTATPSR
jgi:hypothetical protein